MSRPLPKTSRANPHRLRLWLRGERAFGLSTVALPRGGEADADAGAAASASAPTSYPQPAHALIHAPPAGSPRGTKVPTARPMVPPAGDDLVPPGAGVLDLPGGALAGVMGEASGDVPVSQLPPLGREEKAARLRAMDEQEVRGCTRCRLCQTRSRTVFGEGDVDAPILFVGEGPGANEDRLGRPFVGRAGELLEKMIVGMGFRRDSVFIANVVKCRAFLPGPPPKDRAPVAEEVAACAPYLVRQIEILRPRVIVTLGKPAANYLLATNEAMSRLRGTWRQWRGIPVMPTYHPSYVLRIYSSGSPPEVRQVREAVWGDLKQVLTALGREPPRRAAAGEG